jgi:two-component system, NtrC family, sensor histidine kinase HydH
VNPLLSGVSKQVAFVFPPLFWFRKHLGFGQEEGFNLNRVFAALSLICISAIVTASAYVQSRFLTEQVLLRDATVTEQFIESIVQAEGSASYFQISEEVGPNSQLQSFFIRTANLPDVLGSNVFDASGRVLWSSNQSMRGERYDDNDELKEALKGRLVYDSGVIGATDKQEHLPLTIQHIGARFVEIYVPIFADGKQKVVGVVEVYKVPLALQKSISEGLWRLWLAAIAGGALLFLTLFWIVRKASRLIADQHQRLTEVESFAMIGETAAAVTHSIRNPLASIRAAAELSLTDDLEGARESARDIISETDRLTRWTQELLYFSKHPYGQTIGLNLNELVLDVVNDFRNSAANAKINFSSNLSEALPQVNAITEPARHILTSILINARDAMPEGGTIFITTAAAKDGQAVLLSIEDSGPGLPSEQMEKVMRPFYSTKSGGTGLGLPLARQIMERFGGELELKNGKKGLRVELKFRLDDGSKS